MAGLGHPNRYHFAGRNLQILAPRAGFCPNRLIAPSIPGSSRSNEALTYPQPYSSRRRRTLAPENLILAVKTAPEPQKHRFSMVGSPAEHRKTLFWHLEILRRTKKPFLGPRQSCGVPKKPFGELGNPAACQKTLFGYSAIQRSTKKPFLGARQFCGVPKKPFWVLGNPAEHQIKVLQAAVTGFRPGITLLPIRPAKSTQPAVQQYYAP